MLRRRRSGRAREQNLFILLSALFLACVSAGRTDLHNPGFENVPLLAWEGPWGGGVDPCRGDGVLVRRKDGAPVHSGRHAVRLTLGNPGTTEGNAWCGITQRYPALPGAKLEASAWVYAAASNHMLRGGAAVRIKLEYTADEEGSRLVDTVESEPLTAANTTAGTWQRLTMKHIVPDGAHGVKSSVVFVGTPTAPGTQTVWIDDVSLDIEGVAAGEDPRGEPGRLTVPDVLLARGTLYHNGEPFWLKGIGYSPYRPGMAPNRLHPGDPDILREDMRRIREAGFNTLRTWDEMPDYFYELAAEEGLQVLSGATVPLGDFSDPAVREVAAETARVKIGRLRKHPNVLGYLLMNEPEPALFEEVDAEDVQSFFAAVLDAAHQADPFRPASVTPWIIMSFVDFSSWDMLCFNIYNYFPSAVSTNLGYANFIDFTRRTRASDRPFIVTEFGYPVNPTGEGGFAYGGNTEEEQARGIVDILDWIVAGGAQGCCVFEWNDEWWKPNDHPDDPKTHDDDPEEYFGLIAFENAEDTIGTPRPAYYAVRDYYRNLVIEPRRLGLYTADVPVRVYVDDPSFAFTYAVDGTGEQPLAADGAWHTTTLSAEHLGDGIHTVAVHAVRNGIVQTNLTRRIHFLVATDFQPARPELRMTTQPNDPAPGEPVTFEVQLNDPAGNPLAGQPVRLSLLQTTPVSDTFYNGITDEQGRFAVIHCPARGSGRHHVTAWAGFRNAGHEALYAADTVSVAMEGSTVYGPESHRSTFMYTAEPPLIDGEEDMCWQKSAPVAIALNGHPDQPVYIRGRWRGNDHFSGTIRSLWDHHNVYFFADIRDTTPAENDEQGADLWRGDGIELFLSTRPSETASDTYSSADYQFILAPNNKTWMYGQAAGGVRNAALRDVEVVTRTSGDGYRIEARIPWTNFEYSPTEDAVLGIEFVLNNRMPGQGVPTKIMWASAGEAYRTPAKWGRALLKGPMAPAHNARDVMDGERH